MSTRALILASASPRRKELLAESGVAFEALPGPDPEPQPQLGEEPKTFALRAARGKASSAARLPRAQGRWVLGADTIVTIDGKILGKPLDGADALQMLELLQGRAHQVLTAFVLLSPEGEEMHAACVMTEVEFAPAGRERLAAYVAGGEPLDKAGAYAIQGEGAFLARAVRGSYTNVVGLPMDEVLDTLHRLGLRPTAHG